MCFLFDFLCVRITYVYHTMAPCARSKGTGQAKEGNKHKRRVVQSDIEDEEVLTKSPTVLRQFDLFLQGIFQWMNFLENTPTLIGVSYKWM